MTIELNLFQIEDVYVKFEKLEKLRSNNWEEEKPKPKKKILKVSLKFCKLEAQYRTRTKTVGWLRNLEWLHGNK